jgi:hypothetical protein
MIFDGVNALWYVAEGDLVNAGLSAAAFIPVVGDAVGVGKLGVKGAKAVGTAVSAGGGGKAAKSVVGSVSPGEYLAKKAPRYVTPGTRQLEGQLINDLGKVEPWTAYYDEFGRQIARTDYNAGYITKNIPDVHYHTYEYGVGLEMSSVLNHGPGRYVP